MKSNINRRQFLAGMAATTAACGEADSGSKTGAKPSPNRVQPVAPRKPPAKALTAAGRGRVFEALHEHALDKKDQPAARPVAAMLDHLMRELTGKSKVEDAWASLFRPGETVGIKPNARGGHWCSPSPALLDAVIARLGRIGIPPAKIILWELSHFAEHPLYGHLKKTGIQLKLQDELGFNAQVHQLSTGKRFRFNNAVHQVDAILNIGAFKDHGRAGVTGALKNLSYGSIDNPRDHHDKCCDPPAAEIYNQSVMRDKVRLTLSDAFRLIYNRGPTGFRSRAFNLPFNRLYATRDPVAVDKVCWQVIDNIRKDKGLGPLMKRKRDGQPMGRPYHVLTAAKLGLGEANSARITVKKTSLG